MSHQQCDIDKPCTKVALLQKQIEVVEVNTDERLVRHKEEFMKKIDHLKEEFDERDRALQERLKEMSEIMFGNPPSLGVVHIIDNIKRGSMFWANLSTVASSAIVVAIVGYFATRMNQLIDALLKVVHN